MVRRLGEKAVHDTEGHYVSSKLLGQIGADSDALHSLISQVVQHSNLTPAAAAAHIAHQAHKELSGGGAMHPSEMIALARHHYGAPAAQHTAARRGAHRGGLAMGGLALGGYDADYDGGFSFGDFLSKAKGVAQKAQSYAKQAMPIAQQVFNALPQAASVLGSLGLNKLSGLASGAHSQIGSAADKYGDIAKSVIGSGRAHRRGYVRK
jgi:hypothetical protein